MIDKYFTHGSLVRSVHVVEIYDSVDGYVKERILFNMKRDAAFLLYNVLKDGKSARLVTEYVYEKPEWSKSLEAVFNLPT